jgi:hypothetical protein
VRIGSGRSRTPPCRLPGKPDDEGPGDIERDPEPYREDTGDEAELLPTGQRLLELRDPCFLLVHPVEESVRLMAVVGAAVDDRHASLWQSERTHPVVATRAGTEVVSLDRRSVTP